MTTTPTFILTITLIMLALSPLNFDICMNIFFGRITCNDVWWLAMAVLGILFFCQKKLLSTFSVLTLGALSLLLLAPTLFFDAPAPQVQTYGRYLSAIWIAPVVGKILSGHARYIFILGVIGILCLHAQWGITQHIFQHDLGLYVLGESRLSPTATGIAKFSTTSEKLIRAYGPHSHANDFGGSLVIGLALILYANSKKYSSNTRAYKTALLCIAAFFVIGIFLSFSRSAYISLLVLCIMTYASRKAITLPKDVGYPFLFITLICAITISPLVWYRFTDAQDVAFPERVTSYNWGYTMFTSQYTLWGVGIGQYKHALYAYLSDQRISFQPWHIVEIHSIPLLLTAETGIILSFLMYTAFTWYIIRNRVWQPLIVVAPLILLDHYFLTQIAPLLFLVILFVSLQFRDTVA